MSKEKTRTRSHGKTPEHQRTKQVTYLKPALPPTVMTPKNDQTMRHLQATDQQRECDSYCASNTSFPNT